MKKVLSLILCVCLLASTVALVGITSSADKNGDYEYSILADGTAKIEKYTGSEADIVIPSTIDGYTVTTLGNTSFAMSETLESVTVPNTVTYLGNSVFDSCTSLASVTLGTGIQAINSGAFFNTAIYNNPDNWDEGVLYIGDCLISGICYDESWDKAFAVEGDYEIKDGTKVIAEAAFAECEDLTGLSIPESVTGIGSDILNTTALYDDSDKWTDNTLYIDNCLLYSEAEGDFAVADGTRVIASKGLYYTNIANLSIPASVKNIGSAVFEGSYSLENIVVDTANTAYSSANGVLFNKTKTELIQYPTANERTNYTVPNGVKIICESAFSGDSCLKDIIFPESLKAIDNYAFLGAGALQALTIPSSVTYIGARAFSEISTLISFYVLSTNTTYSSIDGVLFNKAKTELICYPPAREKTSYSVPNGVETICEYAFYRSKLESVTFPDSLITLGKAALYYSTSLNSVELGNSVETIERDALGDCVLLKSLTVPSSVKTIARQSIGFNSGKVMSDFIMYGYDDTVAETYATNSKITFVSLGALTTASTTEPSSADDPYVTDPFGPADSSTARTEPTQPSTEPTTPSTVPTQSSSSEPTSQSEPTSESTQPSSEEPTVAPTDPTTNSTVAPTDPTTESTVAPTKKPSSTTVKAPTTTKKPTTTSVKKITLKKPVIKLKAAKKKLTVSYKKVKNAKKYKIQYRVKGTKKWKTKTTTKTKYVLKKLKGGKRYQVRVRAVGKQNKKTIYGSYSKIKTVRVKKFASSAGSYASVGTYS